MPRPCETDADEDRLIAIMREYTLSKSSWGSRGEHGSTYWCNEAAELGYMRLLREARATGCPFDTFTCSRAARTGQLEALKWLREQGCPWDDHTCDRAASEGRLELLQWARANGCPWNRRTCYEAAQSGHLETLRWAVENGCPLKDKDGGASISSIAMQWEHVDVLVYARRNGCRLWGWCRASEAAKIPPRLPPSHWPPQETYMRSWKFCVGLSCYDACCIAAGELPHRHWLDEERLVMLKARSCVRAARIIQARWRTAWCDPRMRLARKRLEREFLELATD